MNHFVASLTVVGFLVAGVPRTGFAANDDVDELIKEGITLMSRRDYIGAMDAFRNAHEAAPSARTFAQIGFVYMATKRWVEAEDQLLQATANADDKWARRNRKVLDESLARTRTHLGYLNVTGQPAGAEIRVDEELIGVLPMRRPVRIEAKNTAVSITLQGFERYDATTPVIAGETTNISVSLNRLARPVAAPLSLALARPEAAPAVQSAVSATAASSRHSGSAVRGLATFLTVTGASCAMAGGGLVAFSDHKEAGWGFIGGGAAAALMGGVFFWTNSLETQSAVKVALDVPSRKIAVAFQF